MNAGSADAGSDTEREGGDDVAELLRPVAYFVGVPDVGDHEFLAARTADDRGVVGGVTQRTGYRDQRIVAGAVPAIVVELFEVVQVDHGDHEMRELVATLFEARFGATAKGAPGQQFGQLITLCPHG